MSDHDALLAHAVDRARWTEIRAMVRSGRCRVFGSRAAAAWIVVSDHSPMAGIVGQPARAALEEAMASMPADVELLVVPDDLQYVTNILATWRVFPAVLHELPDCELPRGRIAPRSDVVVIDRVDASVVEQFPLELRDSVRCATILAAKRVDGVFVSLCGTDALTETRWDVSIGTLAGRRRCGHARDCFLALERVLRTRGLRPVWGATVDNAASLGMARSLGFEKVDETSVLMRP